MFSITIKKSTAVGIVSAIAAGYFCYGIGTAVGRVRGYKEGYQDAIDEIKEAAQKGEITIIDNTAACDTAERKMEVNEPECNGCPESNEPEQEETVAEAIEAITESEEPECKTEEELEEESEEIIGTLQSTGIEWIKEKDVPKYIDGFDYSMENLYFYPEDPDICDTLVEDEGIMDMEELESVTGETDISYIRSLFDEMADNPDGPETLYFVNHDNMCVYTVECFGGLRGGFYKDYREEDEEDYKSYLDNYPELV